ncbi:MAG: hypothetical protein IKI31_03800 [Treponema sp.]|nr:hypothetical protein [Treponema sp.]
MAFSGGERKRAMREWSESESAESPTAAIAEQEQQERPKTNYAKSKKV